MAGIVLPNRFVRQPQYPTTLDPYWQGRIAFASITGLHGGRDLVTKQRPVAGSTVASKPTVKGVASYTGSVADGLVWSSLRPISSIFDTGMAFLMYANPAAGGTLQRAFFLGDELPAVSNQYNQACFAFNSAKAGVASSGIFATFEYNFGFQGAAESVAGTVDGNWHVFIATRPPGFSTWTLYRDGVDVTAGSPSSANGVVLTDGCRVHVNPGATQGYTGEAVLAAAFNGPLSIQQVAKLSANPWQILKAPQSNIWVAVSTPSADGVGSASGTSTVSGVGASVNAQTGSAGGASAVSGVGSSDANAVAASSGSSTVSGTGATDFNAVGSSSGSSAVDGVGTSSTGSSGSASGTCFVSGAGASAAASDGVANGVASVNGIGASEALSTGTSSGTSTVSGVGDSVQAGSAVGSASGTSTVSGVSASVVAAVGSASGDCSVYGVGARIGGEAETFSGGYLYDESRESHAERKRRQRIKFGIIEDDAPQLEQFEISSLTEEEDVLPRTTKQRIPARQQKKLAEQEAENAELKMLLRLEVEREEETILRFLMEL